MSRQGQGAELRLILLGDIDVGKTSLIVTVTEGTFREGIETFDQREMAMTVDGVDVRLNLMDTAGQERFRTLTSSYYRLADAIIITYDVSNPDSFSDIKGHFEEGRRYNEDAAKFIVGNKIDLDREVTSEQGQELANSLQLPFFETSAKTGENVRETFEAVAREVIKNGGGAGSYGQKLFAGGQKPKNKCKC